MSSFESKIPKPVNDVTQSPFADKKPEPLMPDIMEENKLSAAKDNDAAEQQFSNEPGAEQKPEQHALAEENAEIDPDMQWQRGIAAKIQQARENDPNMQWRRGIEAKIIEYNQNDPNMQWRRGIEAKIIEYNQNDPNKQWRRGIEAKIIEYNQNDPNMQWRRGIEAKLEARSKAQLSVSQPGDSKELEADKKSEEVMGAVDDLTPGPAGQDDLMPRSTGGARAASPRGRGEEESFSVNRLEDEKDTVEDKEELSAKSNGSGGELSVDAATKDYINNLSGGEPMRAEDQQFFGERFGADFNDVKIHTDSTAAESAKEINAKAYTKDEHIVFGKGQYQPDSAEGKKLYAHELAHVVQQNNTEIQRAIPAVVGGVIYFLKVSAATTIDILIDAAIGAILALPKPGLLSHVGTFLLNCIPGISELKKVKKLQKLFKLIDKIADIAKFYKKLKVPGADDLLDKIAKNTAEFKHFITNGNLQKAKEIIGVLIGHLREAQVAAKLQQTGAKLKSLGKAFPGAKGKLPDIDVITEQGGQLFFNQVKSGNSALRTKASTKWGNFSNQVERTVKAAAQNGAKVRYYVDNISQEALDYLKSKNIEVIFNSKLLK